MLESGSVDTVFSTVLLDVFVHLGTQWKGNFVNDSHIMKHTCVCNLVKFLPQIVHVFILSLLKLHASARKQIIIINIKN